MPNQFRIVVTLIVLILTFAATTGCEDAAAKERTQVQNTLAELRSKLSVALASDSAQDLMSIVRRLDNIREGEAGQQAVAVLLATTARRELALLHMAEADAIEAEHRSVRTTIRSTISAAMRLHGSADAYESLDYSSHRELLKDRFDRATSLAQDLQQRIAKLKNPIDERTTKNESDWSKIEKLRLEVGDLLRTAQELGHAEGFDHFQQASDIRRRIDRIEYEISHSEIELDYKLKPNYNNAQLQQNHLNAFTTAIRAAQDSLSSFQEFLDQTARGTREGVTVRADEINIAIAELETDRNDRLDSEYNQAAAFLEQAIQKANSAVRNLSNEGSNAARLVLARTNESLGRLYWSRASGLADHEALVRYLMDAKRVVLQINGDSQTLAALSDARDDSIAQAKAAYEQALQTLDQVRSRENQAAITQLQDSLDFALSALDQLSTTPNEPDIEVDAEVEQTESPVDGG